MTTREVSLLRARIQWVRGMCTDEAAHTVIDRQLVRLLDLVDDLCPEKHGDAA